MKTKATSPKAGNLLVGRMALLSFPGWDTATAYPRMPRKDALRTCLGNRAWQAEYADQLAEIVDAQSDGDGSKIYSLLFSDGKTHQHYAHDFLVQPVKPVAPTTWEYTTLTYDGEIIAALNEAGSNGWELVAVTPSLDDAYSVAFFKRQIT